MNSVRIGIIGVLVDRYGIGQAEGFLHFFEGWVMFLSCIAILFVLARVMQRLSGDRRRLGEAIDLDFSGLGGQLRGSSPSRRRAALVAAALMTAALARRLGAGAARAPAEVVPRDPFSLFPHADRRLGGHHRRRSTPNVERDASAPTTISPRSTRARPRRQPVDLFVSYYRSQTEGNAIHSPEVCLPAAGWEVFAIKPRRRSPCPAPASARCRSTGR